MIINSSKVQVNGLVCNAWQKNKKVKKVKYTRGDIHMHTYIWRFHLQKVQVQQKMR